MDKLYDLSKGEDELYRQVYKEFGKTKEEVEEYIKIIEKWGESQHHFPDKLVYNGIRSSIIFCKFSIERAKEKIDMYYTIRRLMPEIYEKHPLSPEMIKQNQVVISIPLPKFGPGHQRVFVAQIVPGYEPDEFKHDLFLVQLTHIIEVCILEDSCFNVSLIFDCKGAKFGHVARFNPMVLRKTAVCLEKVYSTRVSAIYLINFYSFLEPLLNSLFIPLLPKKLGGRIKVLDKEEKLVDIYGKAIIPKDYGGDEMTLAELRDHWMKKYEEYKPRFDKIQYMKPDESKRPTKLKNDDILGYYGSFKAINVD